jgi:hypothetical protein
MKNDFDQLVAVLKSSWPSQWAPETTAGGALELLVEDGRRGRVSSLPFVRASSGEVVWLTVGPSRRLIEEYMDDLRAWMSQSDRTRLAAKIIDPLQATGPTGPFLKVLAPGGYCRWQITTAQGEVTLSRLGTMHRFLASRPEESTSRIPSVSALRLAFVTALRTGDWDGAAACIDEIDHWSLDQATRSLQMRVRLLDAQGATFDLYQFVVRHQLLEFPHPRRIAAAILRAVDAEAIKPLEASEGCDSALVCFREIWYPRVMQAVADTKGMEEVARIQAYAACADRDVTALRALASGIECDLAQRLYALLVPASTEDAATVSIPELEPTLILEPEEFRKSGIRFWNTLQEAVREGRSDRTRVLIAALDSDLLDDIHFLSRSPDALLELLSDPEIDVHNASRLLLQEVIAGLVDVFVVASGFPKLAHLDVYLALMEGLVLLRGEAANEADSQLLLGLLAAVSQLSPRTCDRCESIVRCWWKQRPMVPRIGWLAAALDSLAFLHPRPEAMGDLYIEALELAGRKHHGFTAMESRTWRRIGGALEMDGASIQELVEPLEPPQADGAADALAGAGLRQIAIVSLQESSAREAAKEIAERTGAKVSVVTSLVSDGDTRQASGADLILYVWAASTHATYRAFDLDRDRLEYVQGTGSSSIVAAAERWAQRHR